MSQSWEYLFIGGYPLYQHLPLVDLMRKENLMKREGGGTIERSPTPSGINFHCNIQREIRAVGTMRSMVPTFPMMRFSRCLRTTSKTGIQKSGQSCSHRLGQNMLSSLLSTMMAILCGLVRLKIQIRMPGAPSVI